MAARSRAVVWVAPERRAGRPGAAWARAERAEGDGGGDGAQELPGSGRARQVARRGGPEGAQGLAEVAVDVQVAADVRLGQAQFAGRPEQAAQGAPVADDDHGQGARGVGGAGLAAVPGAEPERHGPAGDLLQRLGHALGGAFHAGLPSVRGAGTAASSRLSRICWTSR